MEASPPRDKSVEADIYEVLSERDVDAEPPWYRPIGPGDVFRDVPLRHLAEPFTGPVMVVGHPCSLRRGLQLQNDVPVAPVVEQGIPSAEHAYAERVLPVRQLIPPGSTRNRVVQLTRTTTVPSRALDVSDRCAALNQTGVIALQQRVVGNQTRVKVLPGVIARHCRGPLTELELWTSWRERCEEAGQSADALDERFDAFMRSRSNFQELSWREALGRYEHARARAVAALDAELADLFRYGSQGS